MHITIARSCMIKALYFVLACVFAEATKRGASAEALVAFMRGKCSVPEAKGGRRREGLQEAASR